MKITSLFFSNNTTGESTFFNKFANQLFDVGEKDINAISTGLNSNYLDKKLNILEWDSKIIFDKDQINKFYNSIKYLETGILLVSGLSQIHGNINQYYLLELFKNDGIKIFNFMYDNSPWNLVSYKFLKKSYGNFPLDFIYTCPIATPCDLDFSDVNFWASYSEKTTISPEKKQEFKNKFGIEKDEKIIFFSICFWQKSLFPSFDTYYELLIAYLIEQFANLDIKTHFFVISNGNFLNYYKGKHGNTNFYPYNLLPSDEYETALLSSDLVISDNPRQSTVVKANSAYIPTIYLKNNVLLTDLKNLSDREMLFAKKMKTSDFIIFFGTLKNIENTIKTEKYFSLLNELELFEIKFKEKITELLINRSKHIEIMDRQKKYFLNLKNLPKAKDILLNH